MCKNSLHTLTLAWIIAITSVPTFGAEEKSNLKILDIKFEPIRQGKNIVRVKVQNTSEQDQIFRIGIYTRSPDYGREGVGWGSSFFDTIKGSETKWTRFAFKIQGTITDKTWLRLSFYNPDSQESRDSQKYFEQKKYNSQDLEHYKAEKSLAKLAPENESKTIIQTFLQIQNLIREKKYEQVWKLFTQDYQDVEFQVRASAFERFKKAMEPPNPIDSAFVWEKDEFLNLQPRNVVERDGILTLTAADKRQTWSIDFIQEQGQWKIDWIAGYTPRILRWQNWEQRLLPTLEKRKTEHFDIYYFKKSTAEKEIDQIAQQKEKGFGEICRFLGQDSDIHIRIVFFEDGQTKHLETGHQGRGWAYGNTIVEVYNKQEQLDPYHETTHILMRPYGSPPALFQEGFAVYMSELLGAHALEYLSGGLATIYERARELKAKGEGIDLEGLLTYTEIGSKESRPPVAYPEAAAFVKFLIDKYSKDKFLQAYRKLMNSDDKTVQQNNIKMLEQIYGKSLLELKKEWESAF